MPVKLTIIGAGPGGYVAAIRAAQKGAQVTVIEGAEVGGTCLNRGCIPTKTLIASAEALVRTRSAADFGIQVSGEVGYNLAKIRERKDKVVATQVKGIRGLLKSWGVDLVEGRGTLLSPDTVRVVRKDGTAADVKSDKVIIATGSRPAKLPGFPFDGESVITSDEAIQLTSIPKSLLIVGAGVIGSEFAFIYRSFGAEVTVVEMMAHAVSTEDEEISELLERELKKAKIKLVTNVKVENVEKGPDGMMVARLSNKTEVRIATSRKCLMPRRDSGSAGCLFFQRRGWKRSRVVPSGHSQPHQARPRRSVRMMVRSASAVPATYVFAARKPASMASGSSRRKRLAAFGGTPSRTVRRNK